MTVSVTPMAYFYEIVGTTSEVRASIVSNKITSIEGYFVDTATGTRYIIGKR